MHSRLVVVQAAGEEQGLICCGMLGVLAASVWGRLRGGCVVALWQLRANRNPHHIHHRLFLEGVLGIHAPFWPRNPQLPLPDTLLAGIRGIPIFPTGISILSVGNTGWLGSKNTLQTINVKLAFYI